MRILPGLIDQQHVSPVVTLYIDPVDASTTFVHSMGEILSLPTLKWEGPLMGGLAKVADYKIGLDIPLEILKGRLTQYQRATARLRVDVSSETFYPHIGRIRAMRRSVSDPDRIDLHIVDKFFDDNPMLPVETMADSYSTVHPEDKDQGYPLYYGDLAQRPAYFTATDCDISYLLRPQNYNKEPPVWFNNDFDQDRNLSDDNIIPMVWNYVNCELSFDTPFYVKDVGWRDARLYRFTSGYDDITSLETIQWRKYSSGYTKLGVLNYTGSRLKHFGVNGFGVEARPGIDIKRIVSITNTYYMAFAAATGGDVIQNWYAKVESGGNDAETFLGGLFFVATAPITLKWWSSVTSPAAGSAGAQWLTDKNNKSVMYFDSSAAIPLDLQALSGIVYAVDMTLQAELASKNYKRYSIFSEIDSGTAISENPIAILDDVFSYHTSTPYLQDQSSVSQGDVSAYKLHCFFAERRPLREIVDEIGKISAVNMWVGDSGMMNYRTFQESANVTIDKTLTPNDFEKGTFGLVESPLGSSLMEGELASRLEVEWGYDFQKDSYQKILRAGPHNDSLCDSANASGVTATITRKSQYIMDSDCASYYLGNLVRQYTQGREYIQGQLPAEHFDLEIADVVKIQNPILVGSEALYQIKSVSLNLNSNKVSITAGRLPSLNP